jgi:hypothetical protein
MTSSAAPEAICRNFSKDGVVLIKDLLDESLLRLAAKGIDKCLSQPSARHTNYANEGSSTQRFFYDAVLTPDIDEFHTVLEHSSLAEMGK